MIADVIAAGAVGVGRVRQFVIQADTLTVTQVAALLRLVSHPENVRVRVEPSPEPQSDLDPETFWNEQWR